MKDSNCPNCGGRSFSAIDPWDYYECRLCERPDEVFIQWYISTPRRAKAFRIWRERKEDEARN